MIRAVTREIHQQLEPGIDQDFDTFTAQTRERLMPDAFNAVWRQGEALTRDEAIALALEVTRESV